MGFELRILDLFWLKGLDDCEDLCLHGHVFVQIGEEVVDDGAKSDWTLSVSAYRMLRTIYENHDANDLKTELLITCCGHSMLVDGKTEQLIIFDCPHGINWSVIHEGGNVCLTTKANTQATIPCATYRDIIFAFADQIERFYQSCAPKTFYDIEDEKAFQKFWTNWKKWRTGVL